MNPIFKGIIKNGKLKLFDLDAYKGHLLNMEGNIELVIRRPKKTKTNHQLRYLFGVVYKLISEHTGMEIEEIDIAMKMMFALNHDTPIPTVKLKRNMTTLELSNMTERIIRFAVEHLGLYIPNPDEAEVV